MYQKGVSLYLAVMMMSILLAMALGMATILFSQLKTVRGMGDSVVAFYVADTGMERAMYVIKEEGVLRDLKDDPGELAMGHYEVRPEYEPEKTYIKSVGIYGGVRRAVRILLTGGFPRIENASVSPSSGHPGAIFTIRADILDAMGVDPDTVIAHIQKPDENDIATVHLPLISGTAKDGTYEADWWSIGAEIGVYLVDIVACNLPGNCRELENLETTIP